MKKILTFLLVIILAFGGFLTWLFAREQDGVPILVYHQVNNVDKNQMTVTVEDFDAQKQSDLKKQLKEALNAELGNGAVYDVYITSFMLT